MHLEDHWMGEKKFRKTLSTVEGLIYLVYFACMWLTSVIKSSHQLAFGEGSFEKYGQWEWGQIWRWGRFSIFPSVPSHPKLQISRWGMPYWGLYCPLRLRIGLFSTDLVLSSGRITLSTLISAVIVWSLVNEKSRLQLGPPYVYA